MLGKILGRGVCEYSVLIGEAELFLTHHHLPAKVSPTFYTYMIPWNNFPSPIYLLHYLYVIRDPTYLWTSMY